METVRVGGRKYSDPDVVALVRAGGGLADPRSLMLTQARRLNGKYRTFEAPGVTPPQRLQHLASLVGLEVVEMSLERRREESRDAVLLLRTNGNGTKGQIFYNPDRPEGRTNFTIAHEIGHTFCPPTSGGARFRDLSEPDSREARELESLCDLAAAELLMPVEEFRKEVGSNWSLSGVPRLSARFGGSFEATAFRFATAHPGIAAAGLLKFRLRKSEQRALDLSFVRAQQQQFLFPNSIQEAAETAPVPKYRRQSFHMSDFFPESLVVRWNKSFNETSVVYQAGSTTELLSAEEPLPSDPDVQGLLEVLHAPYQRDDANPENPDLLFFWMAST